MWTTPLPWFPRIAGELLRKMDHMHLAELHPRSQRPQERDRQEGQMYQQDGYQLAQS